MVIRQIKATIICLLSLAFVSACTNISGASKSSTSLSSFLGISELPDWYVSNQFRYPDSQWIENDFGLKLHYRDVGEGPVIVLLHGEMSSLHTWEEWIDTLSQDFRVIALDLPGSGLTGAPHCVSDPEDTCSENLSEEYIEYTLRYFFDDLKLRRFSLIGSSYGGYLASRYALKNSQRVDKLVLIAPMGFQQDIPEVMDYLTSPGLDLVTRYVQPSTLISTIVDDFYGDREAITQASLERYIRLSQSDGAHESNVRMLKMVRNLMDNGTLTAFDDIGKKTLIMWGELDTWGDAAHAERWNEEISDSLLVKYPFLGHIPMEENPANTLPDVVAFLNDDPLPSIEGLGTGGTFTIQDAVENLDQESLFGAPQAPEQNETEELEDFE